MQSLQNASDPLVCSESVIEAALDVILLMRESTLHRDGESLVRIRAMGVLRKRPGSTLSALAARLILSLSATSRLVDGLVKRGQLAREIPEGNRRTVALYLTAAGAKVYAQARGQVEREIAEVLARLPAAKRAAVTRATRMLRENFEQGTARPPAANGLQHEIPEKRRPTKKRLRGCWRRE
jgi:MarR family transcriptional regulator, organic hydroperoxide resistance regulator